MKDYSRSPTSRGIGKKLFIHGDETGSKQPDSVFVRCKRCGFLCNTNKQGKCPVCGIQNYDRKN